MLEEDDEDAAGNILVSSTAFLLKGNIPHFKKQFDVRHGESFLKWFLESSYKIPLGNNETFLCKASST